MSWILTHGTYQITPKEQEQLEHALAKLLQGYPLPYLLGEWDFYGRTYCVSPDVLIPRPETELLVERALSFCTGMPHPRLIDVGTGSGVIAISLQLALPNASVFASDLSFGALRIARQNAQRHDCLGIHFFQADLLLPVHQTFNFICANLPYIPIASLDQLPVAKWEPRTALDGGKSGLDLIQRLLAQAQTRLTHPGIILLEIEATLGPETLDLATSMLPLADCQIHPDLAGKDRLLIIDHP